MIGAGPVRAIAARIETNGRAGDLAAMGSLLDRLDDEIRRCLSFIPELQETMRFSADALQEQSTS